MRLAFSKGTHSHFKPSWNLNSSALFESWPFLIHAIQFGLVHWDDRTFEYKMKKNRQFRIEYDSMLKYWSGFDAVAFASSLHQKLIELVCWDCEILLCIFTETSVQTRNHENSNRLWQIFCNENQTFERRNYFPSIPTNSFIWIEEIEGKWENYVNVSFRCFNLKLKKTTFEWNKIFTITRRWLQSYLIEKVSHYYGLR